MEHNHNMSCNARIDDKCNAYTTWVKYADGWRQMYIPCEYCQSNWHKEVIDQLHEDLGEGWLEE